MDAHLPAATAETHSAVVFFLGDRAYKVKKPVDLGFLDFRRRDAREAVCHREVELNRRMAPDVYLGVADVTAPDGRLCDHLVVMRRMPTDRRLSTMVRAGKDVSEHLWDLAHQLVALHGASPRSAAADAAAGANAMRSRWESNTSAMIEQFAHIFDDVTLGSVHGLACRYLDGRSRLFDARVAEGRAVDGHGDLLADDVFCLDDGPRALDCIEFDDALRLGDGLADAAFLAMDLERLGRTDLGAFFLAAYAEHAGDCWPASLAHHHIAHRAQTRAKVAAIRAQQGAASSAQDAIALLELAARHLEAGRVQLTLVGGLPGTGKTTLATSLGEELDATVLRSDEIRKEGCEVSDERTDAYRSGLYAPTAIDRVYETMLARTAIALSMGESVILDASWSAARHRVAARSIAVTHHADLRELRCVVSPDVARGRLERRRAAGTDASDATPAIAARMAADAEPWPEATTVDTSRAPRCSVQE